MKKLISLFLLLMILVSPCMISCQRIKNLITNKVTVTFDSNGGSHVEAQTVKRGSTITRPTAPTKEGCAFMGWYYKGEKWNFDTDVAKRSITLHATWEPIGHANEFDTTSSSIPYTWNVLNYTDENALQIINLTSGAFFSFDYKFENDQKFLSDGSINTDGIVSGGFTVNYDAATKLEDVTSTVDAKWGYTAAQRAEGGYAWKITLRDDLKWNDGTPITAADFVYSMRAQLDPDFMNFRANTYYDTLKIKNSREYFYQNAASYSPIVPPYGNNEDPNYSFDMENNAVYMSVSSTGMTLTGYSLEELVTDYVGTEAALAALKAIKDAANEYGYTLITADNIAVAKELVGHALLPFGLDWISFDEDTKTAFFMETLFYVSGYGNIPFDKVGIYMCDDYTLVICLDKSYELLREDGSLSMYAAYFMSNLPLVKHDIYEACIVFNADDSTPYTSHYSTSVATSASWGPYMLTEFEAGSYYKLEKNPYWYGWDMETNKGQYKIDTIHCYQASDLSAVEGFAVGGYDHVAVSTLSAVSYLNSGYFHFDEGSTDTCSLQIFSDLSVLKESANNNGILAITEFRQALSLALNRYDFNAYVWLGAATPCAGILSDAYYYDVENAANLASGGKYRYTNEAKEGILRAYGYTQGADGCWSIGTLTRLTLDEAYASLTGYNLAMAKEKMAAAIAELTSSAEKYGFDASKNITIAFALSENDGNQTELASYIQNVLDSLVSGTPLEGKINLIAKTYAESECANAFRNGDIQILFTYTSGCSAINPYESLSRYIDKNDALNYHQYWNTDAIYMTLTMPAYEYWGWNYSGQTITMSLQNWYFCLNGLAAEENQPYCYNFDAGFAPIEVRLLILSALEEVVIKESRSITLITNLNGYLTSPKYTFVYNEFNPVLKYGGIRYMIPNEG